MLNLPLDSTSMVPYGVASRAIVVPPPVSLVPARADDTVLAAIEVVLIRGKEDEWVGMRVPPTCVLVVILHPVCGVGELVPDTHSLARVARTVVVGA